MSTLKPPPQLKLLGDYGCAGGNCPAVYSTDRQTYIIQGKVLDAITSTAFNLPSDESAVEIPRELLTRIIDELRSNQD